MPPVPRGPVADLIIVKTCSKVWQHQIGGDHLSGVSREALKMSLWLLSVSLDQTAPEQVPSLILSVTQHRTYSRH